MALCSCCSTKPPICSTWLRTFSRSSLKRREMWWVRAADSIKITWAKTCVFVYIRLHATSTLQTIFVTSSAHRRAHRLLPDPLRRGMTGKDAAPAFRALHIEPAAMPLQGVFDDRKTQPRAALPARASHVHAIEALGQARDVFGRDAD